MRFENSPKISTYRPEDYLDTSFYSTLIQLPLSLAQNT